MFTASSKVLLIKILMTYLSLKPSRYQWRLCEPHTEHDPSKAGVPVVAGEKSSTDRCFKSKIHLQLFSPSLKHRGKHVYVELVPPPVFSPLIGRSCRFTRETLTFSSQSIAASWMNRPISSKSIRNNRHILRGFMVPHRGISLETEIQKKISYLCF